MDYQMVIMQFQNLKNQFDFIGMHFQNLMMTSDFDLLKNGIEVINIGMRIMMLNFENNNINNPILNITIQIQNLGLQLQNIGAKFQSFGKMNDNFGMQIQPQPSMEFNNQLNKQKRYIIFKTISGEVNTLSFPYGTTMEKVLETYRIKKPEMEEKNYLNFLFNGTKINPKDKTKVEDFFIYNNLVVTVNYSQI